MMSDSGYYLERFDALQGDRVVDTLNIGTEQGKVAEVAYPSSKGDPLDELLSNLLSSKSEEIPTSVLLDRLVDLQTGMTVRTPKYAKRIVKKWIDFVRYSSERGYSISPIVKYQRDTL